VCSGFFRFHTQFFCSCSRTATRASMLRRRIAATSLKRIRRVPQTSLWRYICRRRVGEWRNHGFGIGRCYRFDVKHRNNECSHAPAREKERHRRQETALHRVGPFLETDSVSIILLLIGLVCAKQNMEKKLISVLTNWRHGLPAPAGAKSEPYSDVFLSLVHF